MEGKLKRVRFRKDGKLDIELETEDGRTEIAEGCTLHIDTDPNSGDESPETFTVHGGEQQLIKYANYGDRQHLQHGLPGGDEADSRRND